MNDTRIGVLFVCLGNICRSPLAEGVFRHHAGVRGWSDHLRIDSCGTGSWHVGEPPDPGSVAAARRHGLDISGQRARQVTRGDLTTFHLILALDRSNRFNLLKFQGGADAEGALKDRLLLLRRFEHSAHGVGAEDNVPDPWGLGPEAFEEVYGIVDRASVNLMDYIEHRFG